MLDTDATQNYELSTLTRDRAPGHAYERLSRGEEEHSDSTRPVSSDTSTWGPKDLRDEATLQQDPLSHSLSIATDVLLSLFPLFFSAIASMALELHDRRISPKGENTRTLITLAPTIFPIIYAAILGRTLRRIALYKAERSARLRTIERLIGSQSVFSAFERLVAFRRFDLLGMALIMAWLLSPLGGQASLRLLEVTPRHVLLNDTITYYPVEGYAKQNLASNWRSVYTTWPLFGPLYVNALMTSKQYLDLPMDQFGNVKIPDVHHMESFSATSPSETWFDVQNGTAAEYTSIISIPLSGLSDAGNGTFSLVSHYWKFECQQPFISSTFANKTTSPGPSFGITVHTTTPGENGNITEFGYESMCVTEDDWILEADNSSSFEVVSGHYSSANCTTFPVLVESRIGCIGRSCNVTAMRKLSRNTDEIIGDLANAMGDTFASWQWFDAVATSFPGADQGFLQGEDKSSELVEHWMMDPKLSTFRWDLTDEGKSVDRRWVNIANLSAEVFTRRLQTAFNTFYQSSLGGNILMGDLDIGEIRELEEHKTIGGRHNVSYTWNQTQIVGTRREGDKYKCHTGFAVITILTSTLLLAAAVLCLILGLMTKAPDMLGYVSASARDNPHVSVRVPSHLDGLDASRVLSDVRIKIGDVKGSDDVGHIAFTSWDKDPKGLSRDRLYD